MEIQPSIMGKTPSTGTSASAAPKIAERRGSRRCKITQLMRIRPSDPEKEHFEDLRGTLSVSRSGVYFQTSEPSYEIGMRLFVTLPYSNDPMSLNREYLAEVVRRDPLSTGMFGIGLKILMAMGVQQAHTPDIWSTGR
jgi:PilZ domain